MCKKHKVGAMPSYGGLEMKSLFMLGAGALGAKVAVNSIANAANLTNPTVATVVKIGGKVDIGDGQKELHF